MSRTVRLLAVLCLVPTFALAQDAPSGTQLASVSARPASPLPLTPAAQWIESSLPQGDSLSAQELARRIGRLYGNQSAMLVAEAEGDVARYEDLLSATMQDLRQLALRPGVLDETRFRELYRSVLTEYENYYGPDPEFAAERGEIFALRAEMFAALDDVENPLLEDVDLPSSVMATFPMEINRAVEAQLQFLLRKTGHLRTVRQRAETYFPMIEQVLAEEGVPDELKYLAVIESALNPNAHSWAGAGGMWQFIPATGRASGLTVTREFDERLDPEAATRAAARHLLELYDMFGDWQLAISGYNCNPAKIRRELRAAEQRLGRKATFWDIYNHIPRETRGYVPAFIATSLIMSNPDAFNLPPVQPGPRYEFDLVPVRGGTTLAAVAESAGTDLSALRALNPALRQSRAPQGRTYMVRVPAGHYTRYADRLDRLGSTSRTASTAPRTVAYHGSNRRVIAFASAQDNARLARSGPAAPVIPVTEVAENLRRGQSAAPAPRNTSTRTASTSQPTTQRVRYRVKRGDTLTKIARQHGVTISQLREWNGIRGSKIRIGQQLTINQRRSNRG